MLIELSMMLSYISILYIDEIYSVLDSTVSLLLNSIISSSTQLVD